MDLAAIIPIPIVTLYHQVVIPTRPGLLLPWMNVEIFASGRPLAIISLSLELLALSLHDSATLCGSVVSRVSSVNFTKDRPNTTVEFSKHQSYSLIL